MNLRGFLKACGGFTFTIGLTAAITYKSVVLDLIYSHALLICFFATAMYYWHYQVKDLKYFISKNTTTITEKSSDVASRIELKDGEVISASGKAATIIAKKTDINGNVHNSEN